jgi:hypothetical protein
MPRLMTRSLPKLPFLWCLPISAWEAVAGFAENSSSATQAGHLFHVDRVPLYFFGQLEKSLDHQRRARKGLPDTDLAALHPLGEIDLALPREKGNHAHLPQVHPNRVVGLARAIGAQVELGEVLALLGLPVEFELRLLQDLNTRAVEIGEDLIQDSYVREVLGQQFIDLVV